MNTLRKEEMSTPFSGIDRLRQVGKPERPRPVSREGKGKGTNPPPRQEAEEQEEVTKDLLFAAQNVGYEKVDMRALLAQLPPPGSLQLLRKV